MKTFTQWAEDNKLELPVLSDTPEPQKTTDEKTNRGGIGAQYPAAYARGQYTPGYFMPTKATAALDLKNAGVKL